MTKEAEDKLREAAVKSANKKFGKYQKLELESRCHYSGYILGYKNGALEYWQSQQAEKADVDLFKLRDKYYDTGPHLTKGEVFEWFTPYRHLAKEEPSDAWISVENPPIDNVDVLFTYDSMPDIIRVGFIRNNRQYIQTNITEWQGSLFTHWQPLPESKNTNKKG